MGKHFGNLQKLKGVTYFTLSPLELNPFLMLFNPGFKNTIRRAYTAALPAIIPFSCAYMVYEWAENEHKRLQRKNPDDFKDEI